MSILIRLNRNFIGLPTFLFLFFTFFNLTGNTPSVSSFRFSHTQTISKFNLLPLFGSKKKGSRFLEDEPDTAISQETLDRLHSDCKSKLKTVEDYISLELSKISDHRAAPSLIDHIYIDTEKGKTQLKHIASIVTKGNFDLIVNPFSKTDLRDIFSDLSVLLKGYTVKLLDDYVTVSIPQVGSDIKKKSQENVKRILNEGRDQIRMARQNTMKTLKTLESGLSQDMLFSQKSQIESHIKSSTASVERMCNDKLASLK